MAIVVNTNMQALQIQGNLGSAKSAMDTAMQRMSTGSKINVAADDAAGMAVSTGFDTKISGAKVAQQNAQIGSNLLTTSEGTLNVVQSNLQRIRDLVEQSANGTYNQKAKTAIRSEIMQRVDEINRLGSSTDFNGIKLFDSSATGAGTTGISLQIGSGSAAATNVITLDKALFGDVTVSALGLVASGGAGAAINDVLGNAAGTGAQTGAGLATAVTTLLNNCDTAINNITDRKTSIGGFQNRLSAAITGLKVQQTNLTAANSTIKDADIAEESANYVKAQILQQASVSLLTQANQSPSIALSLIRG